MSSNNAVKAASAAIGWLALFAFCSFFVAALVMFGGLYTQNQFVIEGVEAYSNLMDAVAQGASVASLISSDDMVSASNFTILILFSSYLPIIVLTGIKQLRHKDTYKAPDGAFLLLVIAAAALANMLLELAISALAPVFGGGASEELALYTSLATAGSPVFVVIFAGIIAPIVEEIVLRRGIQKSLCRINPVFGIVAASIIFGALHGNLLQGIFACLLGGLFGYVYYKTDNLVYSTAMHMTVNLTGCVIAVFGLAEPYAYVVVVGIAVIAWAAIVLLPAERRNGVDSVSDLKAVREVVCFPKAADCA